MFDKAINLCAKPAMFRDKILAFIASVILLSKISYAEAVYIKDFSIDRTEVTVGSFAEYSELEGILTQAEKKGWRL